jgi:tRNA modification GTPase
MVPDPNDTIVALSSAPGPGGRAIVRLSGPNAAIIVDCVFHSALNRRASDGQARQLQEGHVCMPGIVVPLPATLYYWRAPRTYTGQNLAELHTISSPPLVDLLIAALLDAGARAAQPGEFTMRAFLAGKIDLTRAEAVLAVIESGSRAELKEALSRLAGGVSRPLESLRSELLDVLADVEAGLDFADEDVQLVDQRTLLERIRKGLALVTLLGKRVEGRALGGRPFRAVLAGRPNVGKSSLFNALAGRPAALVSADAGTTRDYLVHRLDVGGVAVDLVDTAGAQRTNGSILRQAQALGAEQVEAADLVLLCAEAGQLLGEPENTILERKTPPAIGVATKCDLAAAPFGFIATSAFERTGLEELRAVLAKKAREHAAPALAPSLSRCRHHVEACLRHLRRAHESALFEEPAELVALELRGAVEELGAMVGAVYTDDLLDRIFSRFCIGK